MTASPLALMEIEMHYAGERDISLSEYRHYLITTYHIERDALTERYPKDLGNSSSLQEALVHAHRLELGISTRGRANVARDTLSRRTARKPYD